MAERDIFDRIRSKLRGLSSSHKKIARFFLESYERASRMNSYDIAEELEMSPATVGRFAKALDYSGFPEMLREVQEATFRILHSPMKKLRESIVQNEPLEEILSKVVQHEIGGLEFEQFDRLNAAFIRAAKAMRRAERIFVIAARSSFGVAHYAAFMLGNASKTVFCLSSCAEDRYERLEDLSRRDLVLAISYHRYYKDTIDLAQYAKKSGAVVVGLTDSVFSPLTPFCDEILIAPNRCPFMSYAAAMVVIDALILAFAQARAKEVHDLLGRRISILMENGAYADSDGGEGR